MREQQQIRVGDKVAWDKVRDGMMVRRGDEYMQRMPSGGHVMGLRASATSWESWEVMGGDKEAWPWHEGPWHEEDGQGEAIIVVLGLTGEESADDLRRLAEVFEVREALQSLLMCPYCGNEEPTFGELEDGSVSQPWCTECDSEMGDLGLADEAERLHAAGWRPGDSAERAAELLAAET